MTSGTSCCTSPSFRQLAGVKANGMRATLLCLMLGLSAAAMAGPSVQFGKSDARARDVSLAALLAAPAQYSGKAVRVTGAFRLQFEGNNLCLTRQDLDNYVGRNCLWLELGADTLAPQAREIAALNGRFALMEGIFTGNEHGHMGMNAGAITGIWRVVAVADAR